MIITRVLNTDGVYGYSLSVQEGNNLITNPDPGTYSEITIDMEFKVLEDGHFICKQVREFGGR